MRTIKFRGYNPKNKKWIYGHYFVNRGQHFIVQDEVATTWENYEVKPETIGQYTGMNDKNGTEIYEGDIIRIDFVVLPGVPTTEEVVEWCAASAKFTPIADCGQFVIIEIIGNIHKRKE